MHLKGKCVTHEVDIIAESGSKRFLLEAKYHNVNGIKTHVDVIMYADAPFLDGQYTIWGKVVSGMDAVDKIKKGEGDQPVVAPDKIISATIKYE